MEIPKPEIMNRSALLVLILPFCLFMGSPVQAQQDKIDSLENLLAQEQPEKLRINRMIELADLYYRVERETGFERAYAALDKAEQANYKSGIANAHRSLAMGYNIRSNPDSADLHGQIALSLFKSMQDTRGLADAYMILGTKLSMQGLYEEALIYYDSCLTEMLELEDKDGMSRIYYNLGINYYYQDRIDEAKANYEKALAISEELNDQESIASALFNIGLTYEAKSEYKTALEYLFQALEIRERIGDRYMMANTFNSIGIINQENGNNQEALEYYDKAYDIYAETGRKRGMGLVKNNMGVAYTDLGEYQDALGQFQEALDIADETSDRHLLARGNSNIGEVFLKQRKYDQALEKYQKALELRLAIGNQLGIATSYTTLASLYMEMGRLDQAEKYARQALEINLEMDALGGQAKDYEILAAIYERRGSFDKSLEAFKKYKLLQDSIFNQDNARTLAQLQTEYQTKEKEQQLAMLGQQRKIDELWRYLLIGFLLLALVAGLSIYLVYRYRLRKNRELFEAERRAREQLQEVNEMKSRFFANISHEFRTPLTLILRPVEDQLATTKDEGLRKTFENIQRQARQLLKLINQLLDLSKIESGKLALKLAFGDIIPFLRGFLASFESLAQQRAIQFSFSSEADSIFLYYDQEKIEHILGNLISNALKFTPKGGVVGIRVSKENKAGSTNLRIDVQDSGIGMAAEEVPHVFDRFYQAENPDTRQFEGTGIGLSLTKELTELHGGKIEVATKKGKGSTFSILLPISEVPESASEVGMKKNLEVQTEHWTAKQALQQEEAQTADTPTGGQGPTLLIVEDNQDLRRYMLESIQGNYQTLEAANGKEGLDKALQTIPDLILSDVMMPKMSGFDLCKTLKKDHRTSHIPVILLTAKAGEDQKLIGLEMQADAYMTKPYNARELNLQIENLIQSRKELQKRFAEKVIFQPKEISTTSQEEAFLSNLMEVMESKALQEDFSVEKLANELLMSRSQLNRKISALTNQSPNQFIRRYRLEVARKLLENNTGTIGDIAFEVGFSSPAYFSKVFQQEYGISPKMMKSDV